MPPSLLDTDALSEVMKGKDPITRQKAQDYLNVYGRFTFSILTRYEILRGLKAKQATKQIAVFENRCQVSEVLPLTDPIIVRGADIYADLKQRGLLISDADILIASTALIHNLVLVINNLRHFSRIPGLTLETWKTP
jgi:tRNA(fMet)-specific endonuclease VapC